MLSTLQVWWSGRAGRFLENEDGIVVLEFIVWLGFLVSCLYVLVDASMAFWRQSQLWQVAFDIVRQVSAGGYDHLIVNGVTMQDVVQAELDAQFQTGYTATYSTDGTYHVIQIAAPLGKVGLLNAVTSGLDQLSTTVAMRVEP